jgi:hypothetical protein
MLENKDQLTEILSEIKDTINSKRPNQRVLGILKENYLNINPEDKKLSFDELAIKINESFGVNTNGRDLWLLSEPTIEEDILDVQLMYNNLGL